MVMLGNSELTDGAVRSMSGNVLVCLFEEGEGSRIFFFFFF